MIQFKTAKEKRFWFWSLIVTLTIFSTLFIGRPLQNLLGDQDIQAMIFVSGMILVGVLMLVNGIRNKPNTYEWLIWIGLAAVYMMLFLRLGIPERSHLIEYSVLAIFIHNALIERMGLEKQHGKLALFAFLCTFSVGVIDESIQLFLPHRVFDINDIVFNGFVSACAIGSHVGIQWIRKMKKERRK
ncbi:VanZ family protein [Ekhidna sp.]|uniref:VanZ family protein n=1 Tax=Ekhidna sp. TaxID=2608089 RepID=UPI003B511E3A